MIALQLNELEVVEIWQEHDPRVRCRFQDILTDEPEVATLSGVYFEMEPGNEVARHTHDLDEIVMITSGTAVVTVGDESTEASAPAMVFVPADAPHGISNPGTETLRGVGVLPGEHFVSEFENDLMPFGVRVFDTREIAAVE